MANIFEIPVLNPLRALWQSDVLASNSGTQYLNAFNPAFNSRHFDEDWFTRSLKSWEDKRYYIQPYQQSDTIRVQWLGSDGTTGHYQYARLLDRFGSEYVDKAVTVVQETGTYDSKYLYTVTINLYDLKEGIYYLQLGYNGGSGKQYVIFEPFHVKQIWPGTIRLDYYNSYNDQDAIFLTTDYVFQMRLHGSITEFKPASRFHVYDDQPLNSEIVSGVPCRNFKVIFGLTGNGLPDWKADKLDRIFLCNSTKIDGKEFTRESGGAIDPIKEGGAATGMFSLNVRESSNTSTLNVQGAPYQFGTMPQTRYFWVEQMTINNVTQTIRKMFRGKRNFLDYLNCTWIKSSGYWSEDANGKLIFVQNDGVTLTGTNTLASADVLQYGLRFALSGASDFGADINAPAAGNFYAVVWGDGSANINKTALAASPALTNISHTYSTNKERECFVFFSNGKSMADNVMTITCREIGGDLPPGMTYFKPFDTNRGLLRLENNLFQYVSAMVTFNLSGQNMDTWAINELVRNIVEQITHFDATAAITINGQSPAGPPSKSDPGIALFLYRIKAAITTLTTD